jgi:pimeloyl-ACP methyl ester carboxylesterase
MKEFILSKNKIYYRVNKYKPGRPMLVFVHGLSGSSSAWLKFENRFEKKYNLLTYDLRGHGKSAKPRAYQDYEVDKFSQDLYNLVQFLKLKNFTLVSHSYGTLIVLKFLTKYQALVKSVVFLSPIFTVKNRKLAQLIKPLLGLSKIINLLPFSGKPGHEIDYLKFKNTGDWNLRRLSADIPNTSLRVYFYCLRQFYEFAGEKTLEQINKPIMIIHGEKDTISPASDIIAIVKKIKPVKFVLLKNANHIIVLNNFSEIARAIENFLAAGW